MKNLPMTIVFVVALSACGDDGGTQGDTRSVAAGQSVEPLGQLRFTTSGMDGNQDAPGPPPDLCDFVQNVGALAIVDIRVEPTLIPKGQNCSGPYATFAHIYEVDVLAVATGADLPRRVDVVAVGGANMERQPAVGETWMFTLRESDGQWFIGGSAQVAFEDELVTGERVLLDLPNTFDELSAEAMARYANMNSMCPSNAASRESDSEWRRRQYDPVYHGCSPPDDGECTDEFPCD